MDIPTLISTPKPKARESTWLWLFKIVAGVLIIVLLFIHFIVNHLVAPNGLLSYTDVIQYYTNPIIPIMEVTFLAFVVSHSLVGLRGILLDLNPSDKLLGWIDAVLMVVGVGAVGYGIWLIAVIVAKGQ